MVNQPVRNGYRRTLIDVELKTWATIKHYATIRKITVNEAVNILLKGAVKDRVSL